MQAIKRCYNEDRSETISISLSHPSTSEEECPISSEVIGSTLYEQPYVVLTTSDGAETPSRKKTKYSDSSAAKACCFFSDYPTLSCAEIVVCGHRFDVRALLIHFMRNSMSCPLCRAGVSNGAVLSCKTSFPQEKWMCEAETRIQKEKEKEDIRRQQEDGMLAGSLQSLYYHVSLPSMILNTLQEHTVNASLFFYDMPVPSQNTETNYYPIHGMQFELELLPLEPHHRDLSRGISLYSSFSSNSIATPPPASSRRTLSPPTPDLMDRNEEEDMAVTQYLNLHSNNNNGEVDHNNNNNNNNNTVGMDFHNDPNPFIPLIIPYSGNVSMDDISVHYAMSESTLRQLSRTIRDFGVLSMGGNIYAQHIDGGSTRSSSYHPRRGPHVLASVRPFNLNSMDAAEVLHVLPPGNLVSIRSQEMGFRFAADEGGQFQINRFDFMLDSSSLCEFSSNHSSGPAHGDDGDFFAVVCSSCG